MLTSQFELLAKVYSSEAFREKEIIILLNKSDLLAERLTKTEVRKYFPKYNGDNSEDSVIEFFEGMVEELLDTPDSSRQGSVPRTVKTCALDTKFVESILLNFFISIIQRNMAE